MGLHRLRRDAEAEGDLLVEVAAGEEAKDLALTGGELVELGVDLFGGDLACERVEDEAGEAGEKTASSSRTRATAAASSSPVIVLVT